MEEAIRVLAKRGTVEILELLKTKPMRYVELKEKAGLPHATLTTRLDELRKCGLIEQKLQTDESGRYYLAYGIARREETRISSLKNVYDAIKSLSKGQKKIVDEDFVKSLETISLLIERVYLKAVERAKAREKEKLS